MIKLKTDNHFINAFKDFYKLITKKPKMTGYYKLLINQSRLIEDFRNKSYEK